MSKLKNLLLTLSVGVSSLALTSEAALANLPVNTYHLTVNAHHLASAADKAPILTVGGTQTSYIRTGQNMDPWIKPHALLLGAQRAGSVASTIAEDHLGTDSQIILRGMPDGYLDMGCLICSVTTSQSVFDTRAGLSSNLTINSNFAKNPSFDSVVEYLQPKSAEPQLVLDDVTYDATHIYLPQNKHLTAQQIARIHPNQYITTNSISADVPAPHFTDDSGMSNPSEGKTLPPHNYYVSTVQSVAKDGSSITVNGWAVQGGDSSGHPWRDNDVPTTTYDTVRSNFGKAVAMIGMPTQTGGSDIYMTFDPSNYPHSLTDRFNGEQMNIHYDGTQSGQATMNGIMISYECGGLASAPGKCLHPSYDSTGLLINGNNLPNGIQNTVPSWANEYKGYNFYIPGSEAPKNGLNNAHTSFESFTPTLNNHQLITRQWVQQTSDNSATLDWPDYSVNFGLVVDGTRWDSTGKTGVRQGYISFDYSKANQGGVCIIGNNTVWLNEDAPGLCVRGDGSTWLGNNLVVETQKSIVARANTPKGEQDGATLTGDDNGDWQVGSKLANGGNIRGVKGLYANNVTALVGQIPFIENVSLIRSGVKLTLGTIKSGGHEISDRVWCDTCLNAGQTAGNGSGRWVFLDKDGNWRTDDGAIARE
ncbi:hypothetical protein [Aristophania vespae]|uniref:hypothetical protein n=1 Tax=Aristophania vespae TaxID=2697033 RepID=UPI0023519540|nr:hypothetical protein [Aristophania vespae]UMM63865.1 hypothetical protein DM15PD_08420 [Aristophania vespae]